MLDDGAIQRAVAVMRLEMGSLAEAVPFPANIPLVRARDGTQTYNVSLSPLCWQDKVEEVQANFLQAMVYQEGVLVFRHSADLSYLVVLRALQDNLLKYMEIRVSRAVCVGGNVSPLLYGSSVTCRLFNTTLRTLPCL
jgi:hypothetical protein